MTYQVAPATADALFVRRIRAAGAIFIGKTNTPQFGLGSQVIGRNHDDRSLLDLAAAWERRTRSVERLPPLLG